MFLYPSQIYSLYSILTIPLCKFYFLSLIFCHVFPDFDHPSEFFSHPIPERPPVSSIREIFFRRGNLRRIFSIIQRAFAVVDIRIMHVDGYGKPKCTVNNMLFTPLDFLVTVKSLYRKGLRDAMSSHSMSLYPHAWTPIPTDRFEDEAVECAHDLLKHSFEFPFAEIIVDSLLRGEVLGQ